jgi:hypothetical protein
MTVEFLIHAIVHQTTILIAQLATHGGVKAPLAQIANQVFLDLVSELDRQGVSRKVSADMFGLGLRTYRRKIQRMSESSTERGRSLWEVVLEFIQNEGPTTRGAILLRFSLDDEAQVRAVLRDLCDSQLVTVGDRDQYRITSSEERLAASAHKDTEGYKDLLVALMYREGALTLAEVARKAQTEDRLIEAPINQLVASGRVECTVNEGTVRYEARSLLIPIGAPSGWEAAVFDHFKAVVKTIMTRLDNRAVTSPGDQVGGSTYTIDVWPDHPLEGEVSRALSQIRAMLSDLRGRVAQHNENVPLPEQHSRFVIYAGQCLIEEGSE